MIVATLVLGLLAGGSELAYLVKSALNMASLQQLHIKVLPIFSHLTTLILLLSILRTKAMLSMSVPTSKNSSILTASDRETWITGAVLISTGSLPFKICGLNKKETSAHNLIYNTMI